MGASQSQKGTNSAPETASSSKLQAGSIANQDFLGFWTVDIRQEGHSQRSAPQKRHMAHLRRRACGHPDNRVAGTGEVIRCTSHLGETALARHLVA